MSAYKSYVERLVCGACGATHAIVEVASGSGPRHAYFESPPPGWLLYVEHDYDSGSGDLAEDAFCSRECLRRSDLRTAARARFGELVSRPVALQGSGGADRTGDEAVDAALARAGEARRAAVRVWKAAAATRTRAEMAAEFGDLWPDLVGEPAMNQLRAMEARGAPADGSSGES